MKQTILYFNKEDEALNLSATVQWRDDSTIDIPDLSVRGLGKWRHCPANIIACSERAIDLLKLGTKGERLSKCGINYIGLETKTDILLSKNLRSGKNGTKKTVEFLRKLFVKGLGASSVKVTIHETPAPSNE